MKVLKTNALHLLQKNKLLLVLCLYAFFLLTSRILYTNQATYFFLIWNLFFATLPFLITSIGTKNIDVLMNPVKRNAFAFVWLLFLPNSFYILTDFIHLTRSYSNLFWLDLPLLLSFASLGLILGIKSVLQFETTIQLLFKKTPYLLLPVLFFLCGFGVYLGRIHRFNSWNIITNPVQLLSEAISVFFTIESILFSLVYGSFIHIIYALTKYNHGKN